MSEPDAGSDVSNLRTRAVYDEAKDEWTINGTKAWITNGGIADVHVVVASVDPELKGKGQASFVVPPNTPGLSMGQKYKKHGIRASHTSEVVLDDVKVPGSCLLGGKEKLDEKLARARNKVSSGKQPAMATFEATRPTVGAQALGVARAAYEYSLEYAKERHAFGKPIIMNQAIAFKLANMATEIDASRLLIWRAAWLVQERHVQERRGLDVEVEGVGDRRPRHRGRHPDPRRLRLHPRVPRRALAPRRQDPHDLRRHQRDPAAGHQPGRSPACASSDGPSVPMSRPHDEPLGRVRHVWPARSGVCPGAWMPNSVNCWNWRTRDGARSVRAPARTSTAAS